MDVVIVVRGQEPPHLERTPRPLQADERFARRQHTAADVCIDPGFDLEDRGEAAAKRFRAAHAQTRRVRIHAVEGAVDRSRAHGQVRINRLSVDGFHSQIQATVQSHVRGLRLRSQRGGKHTRYCDSDELFIHGVSPLTDKIGKV
jgi:citrate lyase beta subunit